MFQGITSKSWRWVAVGSKKYRSEGDNTRAASMDSVAGPLNYGSSTSDTMGTFNSFITVVLSQELTGI